MALADLFKKTETLILIDIGSTSIKMIEVDPFVSPPEIVNVGIAPINETIFSANTLSRADLVSEKISKLLTENGFGERRVAFPIPGPAVFTKILKMGKMPFKDLASNIEFETARFLHDNISTVKVDFHILHELPNNQIEVLVVVVKNEILNSFVDCLGMSGLETAIVDVDYFCLQNAFEMAYPDDAEKTVCLINIGARFSSVNICRNGESLYTGSIAVGGNLFTSALAIGLGIDEVAAERVKRGDFEAISISKDQVSEILNQKVEAVAADFNRQLGLFWNVSGIKGGIDEIKITGGGSLTSGLAEKLAEKTGIKTDHLDLLKGISVNPKSDELTIKELAPLLTLVVGMSSRQPGDKEEPDYL